MIELKIPKEVRCGSYRKPYVYISGPMAGRNWDDVVSEFEKYERSFRALGFEVMNPCKFVHENTDDRELTLCEDFSVLHDADFIFLIPGWAESKGCNAEWGYALARNITVIKGIKEE